MINSTQQFEKFVTVFFALAGSIWFAISSLGFKSRKTTRQELAASGLTDDDNYSYISEVGYGIFGFIESIWVGAKLGLLNRRFVCTFFLQTHRFFCPYLYVL